MDTIFRPSDGVGSFMDVSAMIELEPLPPHPGLTRRQNDVLRLLSLGWYNDQIAVELSISRNSVRRYIERIAFRLEVTSGMQRHRRLLRVLVVRKAAEDLARAS